MHARDMSEITLRQREIQGMEAGQRCCCSLLSRRKNEETTCRTIKTKDAYRQTLRDILSISIAQGSKRRRYRYREQARKRYKCGKKQRHERFLLPHLFFSIFLIQIPVPSAVTAVLRRRMSFNPFLDEFNEETHKSPAKHEVCCVCPQQSCM